MGTLLITKAFLLTAVSKKAAHFTVFVKHYFEKSYKKLGPAFLRNPAFLNLVTLPGTGVPTNDNRVRKGGRAMLAPTATKKATAEAVALFVRRY